MMFKYIFRVLSVTTLVPALVMAAGLAACHSQTKNIVAPPAALTYYDEARGVFTLKAPVSIIGPVLRLRGTCSLPGLMVNVRNTGSPLPARQVMYRMDGKDSFDFGYLLKDGPGKYQVTIFGKKTPDSLQMYGLCIFNIRSVQDSRDTQKLIEVNERVLSLVRSVMGTTVGRGECWDLAQEALDSIGADWDWRVNFGKLLDPARDRVKAGDIIQFKSVRLEEKLPDGGMKWQVFGVPDHTAVIVAVFGDREYKLAHQNIEGKRVVITSTVDLKLMTSGRFWIYRPIEGIIR